MASLSTKDLSLAVVAGVFLSGIALMGVSNAYAQVSIGNDGVTFPNSETQTAAVIVPTDCPHSEAIVWDTNSESWVCESDVSPIPYAIGDRGPAGGIVFYVTDGGLHGLEAAPFDIGGTTYWCALDPFELAGADGTAIGSGAQNTVDILAECPDQMSAARLVTNYSLNGFSDWFLPSKDELNQLYLQKNIVGGFASDYYWSSSEVSVGSAWVQGVGSGGQGVSGKNDAARVRAVRAF